MMPKIATSRPVSSASTARQVTVILSNRILEGVSRPAVGEVLHPLGSFQRPGDDARKGLGLDHSDRVRRTHEVIYLRHPPGVRQQHVMQRRQAEAGQLTRDRALALAARDPRLELAERRPGPFVHIPGAACPSRGRHRIVALHRGSELSTG